MTTAVEAGIPLVNTLEMLQPDAEGWYELKINENVRQQIVAALYASSATTDTKDADRWRWLFGDGGKHIMVSVKLRQKRDGDMHDGDTKKYGVLTMGPGFFPSSLFRKVIDDLRSGGSIDGLMDEAILDSDVTPNSSDRQVRGGGASSGDKQ